MDFGLLQRELGFKKKPIPFPLANIQEVKIVGERYGHPLSKFLFYWLYLTGQRISEALTTRNVDVSIEQKEGVEFLVVNSITLKNRVQPRRTIPVPFFDREKDMTQYVWDVIENMEHERMLFQNFSRTNAWNYLSAIIINVLAIHPKDRIILQIDLPIYPHYLRHCRASHLAMFYGYDLFKLMQFFGWSTPAVASVYATLNWNSLAEPFLKKNAHANSNSPEIH